jgi:hypothetical protein
MHNPNVSAFRAGLWILVFWLVIFVVLQVYRRHDSEDQTQHLPLWQFQISALFISYLMLVSKIIIYIGYAYLSRLGGVLDSVLATGPKVLGFELGQGDWLLRAIKIRSTACFGWEVMPEFPRRKILRHVKELLKYHGDE